MAPRNAHNIFHVLGSGNGKAGTQGTSEWIGLSLCFTAGRKCVELEGVWTKLLLSVGITLLLVPSVFALDGEMFFGLFCWQPVVRRVHCGTYFVLLKLCLIPFLLIIGIFHDTKFDWIITRILIDSVNLLYLLNAMRIKLALLWIHYMGIIA